MEALKKGGMSLNLVVRGKNSGNTNFSLVLTKSLTQALVKAGYKRAKVSYQPPNKIILKFYHDEMPGTRKICFLKSLEHAEIFLGKEPLNYFPSLQSCIPYFARKGSVSLRGNEALVVFPFLEIVIFPPTRITLPPESSPIDQCDFYSISGRCRLKFRKSLSRFLSRMKVRGCRVEYQEGYLILTLEKDCHFQCKECPRINCVPLSYRKSGKTYLDSSISLKRYFQNLGLYFPAGGHKSKVWLLNNSILVVEVPFLEGAKK